MGPETVSAVQADGTNARSFLQTRAPPSDTTSHLPLGTRRAGEGESSFPFPTSRNLNTDLIKALVRHFYVQSERVENSSSKH